MTVASRLSKVACIINGVEKEYPPPHHASSSRKRQYAEHICKEAKKVLELLKYDADSERRAHLNGLNVQCVS